MPGFAAAQPSRCASGRGRVAADAGRSSGLRLTRPGPAVACVPRPRLRGAAGGVGPARSCPALQLKISRRALSPDGAGECHCSQRGGASCVDDRARAESCVGAVSRRAAARCGGRRAGSCAFLTAFWCSKRRYDSVLSVRWRPGRSRRSIGRVPGLRRFAIRLSKTCCTSERSNGLLAIRRSGCAALSDAFRPEASGTLLTLPPTRRPEGIRPVGRAGGQSKHRQKPRPRRARRSALTWLVAIPRARSSRPITSRQTPISSAI
jgi:hypothetical protein